MVVMVMYRVITYLFCFFSRGEKTGEWGESLVGSAQLGH